MENNALVITPKPDQTEILIIQAIMAVSRSILPVTSAYDIVFDTINASALGHHLSVMVYIQ